MVFNLDLGSNSQIQTYFLPQRANWNLSLFPAFYITVCDVELPSLRNANVNIKGNAMSLPTLMKIYNLI